MWAHVRLQLDEYEMCTLDRNVQNRFSKNSSHCFFVVIVKMFVLNANFCFEANFSRNTFRKKIPLQSGAKFLPSGINYENESGKISLLC